MNYKNLLILMMFTLLTSCSIFGPVSTSQKTYVINPEVHPPVKTNHRHSILLVSPVSSDPIYNTTQMIYSTKPYEIAYFSKNEWAETPPQMLQTLLVQTLQNTHHFYAVTTSPVSSYNYILNAQLLELRQVFNGYGSQLYLKMRIQIVNAATNQVIATKQFSVVQTPPFRSPYGGVIAANRAAAIMMNEIARLCLQKI
ncbi:MAG: ABC-type transport auxiliary lipoprotein family protein [Gammaproteobacteria bacterium]